jgi:hypothetical protein
MASSSGLSLTLSLVALVLVLVLFFVFTLVVSVRERFAVNSSDPSVRLLTDPSELASEPGLAEYFGALTPCDVAARLPLGCADAAGYLGCLISDVADVVDVAGAVAEAESRMRAAGFPRGFFALGPWRIAVLDDRAEGGWPHTHGGVVCLPASMVQRQTEKTLLVRTLVHERVHVYQRADPAGVARLVQGEWGLRPVPRDRAIVDEGTSSRRRSNPDLDGNVYVRPGTGSIVDVCLFPSIDAAASGGLGAARTTALDIGQQGKPAAGTVAAAAYEHPYEAMAYLLAELAVPPSPGESGKKKTNDDPITPLSGVRRWIRL